MTKTVKVNAEDLKRLVEAAQLARYSLGGSGHKAHDDLAAALKPFTEKEKA